MWAAGRPAPSQELPLSLLEYVFNSCHACGCHVPHVCHAHTHCRSWNDSMVDDIFGGTLQSTQQCQVRDGPCTQQGTAGASQEETWHHRSGFMAVCEGIGRTEPYTSSNCCQCIQNNLVLRSWSSSSCVQACGRQSHCFDPIMGLAVPIPPVPKSRTVTVQDCLQVRGNCLRGVSMLPERESAACIRLCA